MPSVPPPSEQFWLLTGEVPSGPFTVVQVHSELAAGRATWQTPACPVGGSTWLPLVQTPGIGPTAPPRPVAGTRLPEAHPAVASVASAPPATEPAPVGSLEGVFAAKSPAPASRSTPSDATPSDSPTPPADARRDQPQASAKAPQPNGPSQSNQSNQSNRFWLLVGTEATGPFRDSDLRARVQSGKLPPDAKVRRVGTEVWVPLAEAVGPLPPPSTAGSNPAAAGSGTDSPASSASSFLQVIGLHPQVVQVGIGLLLMVAFLGLLQSCKEDTRNQPSLQERLKEQRNKNPLPPVPPPKTTAQPER